MEYSEDEKLLMDYLDGRLEAAGVQVLENRLLRETKLKQKLALYEWSRQSVRVKAIRNLVEQSQHNFLANQANVQQSPQKSSATRALYNAAFRKWIAIAASVLIFMTLGTGLYLGSISGSELYHDRYLSYEISSFRGDEDGISIVAEHYRNRNYTAMFEALSDSEQENLSKDDLLLMGVAYLEIDEPHLALNYLDILNRRNAQDKSGELQDERDFYAALAYIRMENFSAGHALIVQISQDPSHKYNKNFPFSYRTKVKLLSLIK
jgi:hypothetical protein